MSISRVVGCLLLGLLATSHQLPSQAGPKHYKVSGTVVNSITGQPIARAQVTINGTMSGSTMTGDDGQFEFNDVPEGQAVFQARRPGFLPDRTMAAALLSTAIHNNTSDITVKLVPGGSLSGHVTNNEGEPIEDLTVMLLRRLTNNGVASWTPQNSSTTDDTGAYRFENVAAGNYLLRTQRKFIFVVFSDLVIDGRHLPEVYPEQYYPSGPDRATAQPIQVQPGSEASADMSLTAVPGFTISGVVVGNPNARVTCDAPEGGGAMRVGRRNYRNGEFVLSGIPSGPCRLVAQSFGQDGQNYGELSVNVNAADISGVRLALQPVPEIPVIVTGADVSGRAATSAINLLVLPAGSQARPDRAPYVGPASQPGESGRLALHNAWPGAYRVIGQASGNHCIGTMRYGGTDLQHEPLTIQPGSGATSIEVTLRSDCGAVTGKIDGAQSSSITWLLYGMGEGGMHSISVRGDSFSLPLLTPGDYLLYAVSDVTDLEYQNPEVMKSFEGTRISVNAGEKAQVQLKPQSTGGKGQ